MIDKISWRLKAGLLFIFCLILAKYVLVPLHARQNENIQSIKLYKRAVAQKKSLIGSESRIDSALQKAKSSYEETAQFYYQDFSDVQSLQLKLQKEMEQLSESCGVKIKSTDWLYPSEGHIVQAPIKIKSEGAPDRIIEFIHAVESGKHFFSVDRLKIVSGGKSSTVRAELDVSAYGIAD